MRRLAARPGPIVRLQALTPERLAAGEDFDLAALFEEARDRHQHRRGRRQREPDGGGVGRPLLQKDPRGGYLEFATSAHCNGLRRLPGDAGADQRKRSGSGSRSDLGRSDLCVDVGAFVGAVRVACSAVPLPTWSLVEGQGPKALLGGVMGAGHSQRPDLRDPETRTFPDVPGVFRGHCRGLAARRALGLFGLQSRDLRPQQIVGVGLAAAGLLLARM